MHQKFPGPLFPIGKAGTALAFPSLCVELNGLRMSHKSDLRQEARLDHDYRLLLRIGCAEIGARV